MAIFSSLKESDCFIVLDIGSGSVAGALILQSNRQTSVLYSYRCDITYKERGSAARLLSSMLKSLSVVVLAISKEGFKLAGYGDKAPKIKDIVVSLSAPWITSKTSFLSIKNENKTLINATVFNNLLTSSNGDGPGIRGGIKIEQKLIKSILDGYETINPYGKEASEAQFVIFESFSLPKITEKITDSVSHIIHPKHFSFHSFSLLSFAAIRELFSEIESFLLIDLSGEQTEVSIIKQRILLQSSTFPFGRNDFIRQIRYKSKIPASTAVSFIKLYTEKSGTGALFEKVKSNIESIKQDWISHFSQVLRRFSEEFFIPNTIFLTADDDISPIFSGAFDKVDFTKFTFSPASFDLNMIDNKALTPHIKWVSHSADPFISLVAITAGGLIH